MGVRFTEEQRRAIDTLDRSILVSAAAGSGKTAVLVERILSIILEGKANVDEMLIVTFTKAAAAEMRLRLSKAIQARMKEKPEEVPGLKEQLGRLYRAYISTIDSFALRVMREFFYATDIDPGASACDEVTGELMRREAVNEVFEEGFEDDGFLSRNMAERAGGGNDGCAAVPPAAQEAVRSVGFREFLRLYSDERSDEMFKDSLLEAYANLRTMPDYFSWAYEMAEELRTAEDFGGSGIQRAMLADAGETFRIAEEALARLKDLMYEADLKDMFDDKLAPEEDEISSIAEEVRAGRLDPELISRICNINYSVLRARKDQKEAYEAVKEDVRALRKSYKDSIQDWASRYASPDLETRLREMNETYRYTVYYIRLLQEFEKHYAAKKAEKRVMDFADMEHGAVAVLKNDQAAETLRRRFKYIFVDEYQDTNNIQEYLIGKVSRPDNVFKVGDVKQSIYKFRQAEPEIFERVYREYSDPLNEDGITIDLSKNFRSNDATVRYINRVFREVMEGYDERAMLYTGCQCREEYDFVPEVHVLTTEDQDDGGAAGEDSAAAPEVSAGMVLTDSDAADAADEDIADLSKEEAEAAYIADLAAGIIGTEFHDTKTDTVRRAVPGDVVILLRAVRVRGDLMARALRERGIEPHVEETDDYYDTVEVSTALSLLMCIDNMKRDVPLIASLHSAAFGWTPAELASVRICHNAYVREAAKAKSADAGSGGAQDSAGASQGRSAAYHEAFNWYRASGPEGELKEKASLAYDKILEWRSLSRIMPLDEFVWTVLTDSGLYRMTGAMNGGARRQANLRALADRAGRFSSETVSSLSSFITFLDALRKRKISNGQAPMAGSDDNVVRISTIHKSKGLEYPFVIVGGLGHDFRRDGNEKKFSFDPDIGVGLPYIDPARRYWRSSMMQRAITARSRRDSYREELRVLYVAMTRARNKLIMVGTVKNTEKLMEYTAYPNNYLKVMRDVIRTADNRCYIRPLERRSSGRTWSGGFRNVEIPDELTGSAGCMYDEIDRRFRYEYPDADLLRLKAKFSVSEIRRAELEAGGASAEVRGMEAAGLPEREGVNESRDTADGKEAGGSARRKASAAENKREEVGSRRAAASAGGSVTGGSARRKASAAEIGTAYHRIMEFVDFTKVIGEDGAVDEAYIRDRAEALAGSGAIDRPVYEAVDLSRIAGFFACDTGRRAAAAAVRGDLRREKPFTLRTVRQGRSILVQGVIDCCFEEDGNMILIDYKSGFVRPGAHLEEELERITREYRTQIELYAEAITKGTGLPVAEAYLYLFSAGRPLQIRLD